MARPEKTEIDARAIYSLKGAATAIGMSPATVRRYLNEGRIKGSKPGERDWKIRGSDLLKWLDDRQIRPTDTPSDAAGAMAGRSRGETELVDAALSSLSREMRQKVRQ